MRKPPWSSRLQRASLYVFLGAALILGVESAATGDESLARVTDEGIRPDLVLSDYHLPGQMNGVETIEALRAVLARTISGIVLTGDIEPWVLKAITAHDPGVATKPWTGDELLQPITSRLFASPELINEIRARSIAHLAQCYRDSSAEEALSATEGLQS